MNDDNSLPQSTSNNKIRHEWYQTEAFVVVTILVRNVKQEDLSVSFTETNLHINLKLSNAEDKFIMNLNLSHKIVPDQCSYKILSTKIEIKLKKLDGIQWSKLEGDPNKNLKVISLPSSTSTGPPRYPTSNPLHRDWDAIEKQIMQEIAQEKAEGDDGVNKLFQKIYGAGSDEVKRAMNKSYIESGGTVLSTNWNEIAKDKVPVKPPDGMEWKKWND